MIDSSTLVHHAMQYREIIEEYCKISAKLSLSESEADRIAEILGVAQTDSMLSFLLDEADHMLACFHHLIDEAEIAQSQQKLQVALDQTWLQQLLLDLSTRLEDSQCKTIQCYLKDLGFYNGAIDGVVGPQTQAALKNCSETKNLHTQVIPIHMPSSKLT